MKSLYVYHQATMGMIINKHASKVCLLFNVKGLKSLVKISDERTITSQKRLRYHLVQILHLSFYIICSKYWYNIDTTLIVSVPSHVFLVFRHSLQSSDH